MRRTGPGRLPPALPLGALLATVPPGRGGDVPTGGVVDRGPDGEPTATTLPVFMTDAPGELSRVWIRVDDLLLSGDDGVVSLLDDPTRLVELTALASGTASLVEERPVDPGSFHGLRLVVGGAVLETTDDAGEIDGVFTFRAGHPEGEAVTGDLLCPGCDSPGFPVRLADAVAVEKGENGILLDFDVTRGFAREAGGTGAWVMTPPVNGAAGGESPPPEFTGSTAVDGTYSIGVLVPGEYELSFVGRRIVEGGRELVFDASVSPEGVAVPAGTAVVEGGDYTIESADCQVPPVG